MEKILFICCSLFMLHCAVSKPSSRKKCERIKIPMCLNIGYNVTFMPNQFHHFNQEEAGLEVHQFWPLVQIKCSSDLRFFLCSLYAPVCVENYDNFVLPCRSVCERAKAGCAPLMKQYGFDWPARMDCSSLPEKGDDRPCMDHRDRFKNKKHSTITPTIRNPASKLFSTSAIMSRFTSPVPPTNPSKNTQPGCACVCESTSKTNTTGERVCVQSCLGHFRKNGERIFIQIWLGIWSSACFISTAVTILTLLIDRQRFNYPERPIIYLSICYSFVSFGFLIRVIAGHEAVACDGNTTRHSTNGPAVCTIVFLLTYFFGMASHIWWVILSFSWFLAAGLKWGKEAISKYSQFYHLAAWSIPTIKCVAAFASASVDGDPVSGICYVGNNSVSKLITFVIVPLCTYLIIGLSFLFLGLISLFRIRRAIKQQGNQKTEKLEKLMIRIGIFSVLYTVPASIVLACCFYEEQMRAKWETGDCHCGQRQSNNYPDFSIFMLKYFMLLFIGVISGFWMWSGKTLQSWRQFFRRLRPRNVYTYPASRLSKYSLPTHYQSSSLKPLTFTSI